MTWDNHKNFAISTVATAPSPAISGTSLVVASGDGTLFPAAPFNAVVWPSSDPNPTAANAEIVRVTAKSTDTLTITRAQEGTSARSIAVGDVIAASISAKTITDLEGVVDANTAALAAHLADTVDAHDASAISFSPAAGVSSTDVQAAIEEVAGDVSAIVAGSGLLDVQTYTATGAHTWSKPSGATMVEVICVGAGGGGGGGASSVATAKTGGGGGGGGAVSRALFRAADLGSTETAFVGTGGTGGGGGAAGAGANGSAGVDGTGSSFGTSKLYAGAGGKGGGGLAGSVAGGGGGSQIDDAAGSAGGSPAVSGNSLSGQGATTVAGANARSSEWGGASGAGTATSSGTTGGDSVYGGPGGGHGGTVNVSNISAVGGGTGGDTQSYAGSGVGNGLTGGAGVSVNGTTGNPGATTRAPYCGGGGGGGAAGTGGTAGGNGGAGGPGAGGGGGGAAANAVSSAKGGDGGPGGDGYVIVISY